MSRTLVLAAFAAAGLMAACSNDAAKTDEAEARSGGAPSRASVAADAQAPLPLTDVPKPRPGLWRATTRLADGTVETRDQCVKENDTFAAPGAQLPDCEAKVTRVPGGYRQEDKCVRSGAVTFFKMTVIGDFQTRVTSDAEVGMEMAGAEMNTMKATGESVWIGPCPAEEG